MSFRNEIFFRKVLQIDSIKHLSPVKSYELLHSQHSMGKFQEWYKTCCGKDGRLDLIRFMVLLADFCELPENRITQIFHFFDFYKSGSIDATDLYLILALMVADSFNLRVLFLYQHHNNIIPYVQFNTGNIVSLSELLNLVSCAGVHPSIVRRVIHRLSKDFTMNSMSISVAVNFLFACFLEQDRRNSHDVIDYESGLT